MHGKNYSAFQDTMATMTIMLKAVLMLFFCLLAMLAGPVTADWTATCTAGCTCKWADGKKVAECPGAGFTTIPENLSPEIQVLDLRGNQLGVLVNRAFSSVGLLNLQRIFLRNCSLTLVEKDAFHDLNIMVEVDLSHNQLHRFHPETFTNNEKLRSLSLSHNPLEKLEAHQFPPLPNLRSLELVKCQLEMVDKKAFMHLSKLETLKLSANKFTNLKPEVFLPLNKLKSLDLQDNPWNCDCRLLALRDYLSEANLNSTLTLCTEPEHLKGKPWSRLAAEDFACKPLIDVNEPHVEGRLGFDVTFSCRVSGNPPPTIWWVLQNRQIVNTTTASQSEQFVIRQSTHPTKINPSIASLHAEPQQPEFEYWSNLTLRRISEQDAGQYRCIARNKGGQVDANVSLQTPPAPVTILIEEETGLMSYTTAITLAVVGALVLLVGLVLLIVCLVRRVPKRKQPQPRDGSAAKLNGSAKTVNGNGSIAAVSEQEKSLLDIEMDQHTSLQNASTDGYHAVSQTDIDAQQHMQMQLQLRHQQLQQQQQQQQMRMMHGSNTYIPGDRYDTSRVPESLTRHLMMLDGCQVQQNPDGSFYPDLLDIPHRGARGGGSPSTHSGASNETANQQQQHMMMSTLSAAQLAGHPSYGVIGLHPPLQFTDSSSTTSSTAVLLPVGARPGYVTLPRRPRPRMPSWASSPPPMSSSSPGPGSLPAEEPQQPLYDTIGPRVTADGSSTSALSLNKIAGLTPNPSSGLSPRMQSSTLSRGHKISLPAYYVPIEEVDIPPPSPLVQQRRDHQQSTPNILSNGQYEDHHHHHHRMGREPVLGYFNNNNNSSTPIRRADDSETQHLLNDSSTPTSANTSYSNAAPEVISPIPDFRTAGSRASVSSLSSNTGLRRKIAPAVPPKPPGSIVVARPASVVPYHDDVASPAKVAPKPPPKPKKRLSTTGDSVKLEDLENGGGDSGGQAAYEDEGEDGTEV